MTTEQVCCVTDFTQNLHQIYIFLSDLLSIVVDTVYRANGGKKRKEVSEVHATCTYTVLTKLYYRVYAVVISMINNLSYNVVVIMLYNDICLIFLHTF